jgi:predicted RNA-binding Zn-ribbon protein involved in translation (DUF1610 family)
VTTQTKIISVLAAVAFIGLVAFLATRNRQPIAQQVYYDCQCISCGYKMQSEQHCSSLRCPECGGQMRRVERPGPGR